MAPRATLGIVATRRSLAVARDRPVFFPGLDVDRSSSVDAAQKLAAG